MNTNMRKATPDSDAVVSSEDERPWPTAPAFGTLPHKENGVPGIGGGIWSTQKRGSFKMDKAAQRIASRDLRLGGVNQARTSFRGDSTPSPSASDGSGALPFTIPLQPNTKAGRSLSHSQGQREFIQAPGVRSGSNEPNLVHSLGFLPEEVDTETDSELGGGLRHTISHPPIGTLHRTSTHPAAFESHYGFEGGRGSGDAGAGAKGDGKFESAFANLSMDTSSHRRSQWQTHLGWDDVTHVNESRRHSMAEIPTRRGSLVGADGRPSLGSFWPNGHMYDWEEEHADQNYRDAQTPLDYGATGADVHPAHDTSHRSDTLSQMKFDDKDDQGRPLEIPSMYKVPFIKIAEHERSEQDKRGAATMSNVGQWGGGPSRPRKQLYIVSFKCSRVEVFYLLDNTGLFIKEGDIVIVEADRGQDLGTVQHANVTPDDARLYKRKYGEEQYKWLMMFSKNNQHGNVNPNAQHYGESSAAGARSNLIANAPATMQGLPRDNFNNLKPKAIKRLANGHEIRMLSEKEGNEAKAKRACQQKVAHLHLDMEILDAEWQWDFQKLIFYYYADHYINFKDLITELYRIYKTRIWLSAINPASFSQHALGQPPSGIGPGAIAASTGPFNNPSQMNNTYTMMYGADPDPYGAIPPYRIGYDTYTPNYPGIPGVANSFAPAGPGAAAGGFAQYGGISPAGGVAAGDANPSVPPGVTPTGSVADYNYYYDRSGGSEEQTPKPFSAAPTPFSPSAAAASTSGVTTPFFNPSMYLGPPAVAPSPAGPTPGPGAGNNPDRPSPFPSYAPYPFAHLGQGIANIAQGLGRQSNLPAPIGTRPLSGGNVGTPTANPTVSTPSAFGAASPLGAPGGIGGQGNVFFGGAPGRFAPPASTMDFVPAHLQQQQQQQMVGAGNGAYGAAGFGGRGHVGRGASGEGGFRRGGGGGAGGQSGSRFAGAGGGDGQER